MTIRSRAVRPRAELRWLLTGSSRRSYGDPEVWSHLELSTGRPIGAWPSGHRLTGQKYLARPTSRQEVRPEQRQELPTKVRQAARNLLIEAGGRRSSLDSESSTTSRTDAPGARSTSTIRSASSSP